jgi:hypothetical protein
VGYTRLGGTTLAQNEQIFSDLLIFSAYYHIVLMNSIKNLWYYVK